MKLPKFLVGLLIGGLLAIVFWYWQKSTSAEDGALSVLERLAASDARARDLETHLSMASAEAVIPPQPSEIVESNAGQVEDKVVGDNFQELKGIGPTYARRLQDAGITSFTDLAGQTADRVMEITAVRSEETAKSWISEAQDRLNG